MFGIVRIGLLSLTELCHIKIHDYPVHYHSHALQYDLWISSRDLYSHYFSELDQLAQRGSSFGPCTTL